MRRLLSEEDGLSLMEFILIISLAAILVVAGLVVIGNKDSTVQVVDSRGLMTGP